MKIHRKYSPGQALAEKAGLEALSEAVRTPNIIECSKDEISTEWIDITTPQSGSAKRLAEDLIHLHKITHTAFGWHTDNFIGATPQKNSWNSNWTKFFLNERLEFQFSLETGQILRPHFEKKRALISDILDTVSEVPSLCHGDLWHGNLLFSPEGEPVFIDPAVYFGHRETDLAMMHLFGGFDGEVFDIYQHLWPLAPHWEERQKIYQLYHVVNHANIFSGGYVAQSISILEQL